MKLSLKWLADYTDVGVTAKEYADGMTMSGSKVETVEKMGEDIINVVAGRVNSIERHPDSDHLWICQVDVGEGEPIQIVTGAQNVNAGDMVPVAKHKSTLPGGVHIEKGKLRGVASNGMLCSLKELGLTVGDFPYAIEDGIFIMQEPCSPGDDIRTVLGLDDTVIDFEITNNRPDCLSIRGLARESAVTFGKELRLPEPRVKGSGDSIMNYLDIDIADADLCPRYTARYVKNVRIGPSPKWMRQRLRACGIRPINNIVDITNYVMLEYGQPMHAFDYACLDGSHITVRRAYEGEKAVTLDGIARDLTPDMLVIADDTKAVALAGVMGGENSEITESTKAVVFESANFNGVSVRKTALSLAMRTDASSRFEKGLDPLGTIPAVERACELVEMLDAGDVVDGMIDVIAADSAPYTLELQPEKINALLGTDLSPEFMKEVLVKLGCEINGDTITVPSWRADIRHYSDVAEEVARFYGYDVIGATMFGGTTAEGGFSESQKAENLAGAACRALGYSEILTYSFIGPNEYDNILLPADSALRRSPVILNPLGEGSSIMRTTALPSMLETLGTNYSRRNEDVRLYEMAKVYPPADTGILADEHMTLVLGAYAKDLDFFTFKGTVEGILSYMNVRGARYAAVSDNSTYHPGRCASISVNGVSIGVFGQLHPKAAENYGIDREVYAAEFDFPALCSVRSAEGSYTPLPRFPAVTRDIAVICDASISAQELEDCITENGGKYLRSVKLFDVYTGAPIPAGKKSVAFSLTLRADDQTLTDDHADETMSAVTDSLAKKLGAVIR